MKILHTSDWHLGQKFLSRDRLDEHRQALDFLAELIETESVDALIVAGDIFDVYNPPNHARELYFGFLKKMVRSTCQQVVITAGNHDSPSMLAASKEILQLLDIQVIATPSDDPKDQIIELKTKAGDLGAVVAAVPFLRDEDIRKSVAGQTDLERSQQLKQAIADHYARLADCIAQTYPNHQVPVIATGHLYAKGAQASDKQDNIYIGNIENIDAGQFPAIFDYVALGHIHRAQPVGGLGHIRYSGSIIPLSFSETKDEKSVYIVEFDDSNKPEIRAIPVPVTRRLKTIEGSFEEVKKRLSVFALKARAATPWVEIIVHSDEPKQNILHNIQHFARDLEVEILKIQVLRKDAAEADWSHYTDLAHVDHFEVFEKKCLAGGASPEDLEILKQTYRELTERLPEILAKN
ncbi:MAG: exonuclease subunit SbcD [Bacteroidetes bacterium]|nr:MAG: exonuclease subunit SbcD [Bacteroidota bacterium]